MARKETGIQFLARLGTRPSLAGIEPLLFDRGPYSKDVVELYGPEGSGKTEMLLHVIVRCIVPDTWNGVALNGCGAQVVYVDTDYKFSILRLASLIESYVIAKVSKHGQDTPTETPTHQPADTLTDRPVDTLTDRPADKPTDPQALEAFIAECLERLHIVRCSNSAQFVITLHSIEKLVCNTPDISAIMIDSISALYWIDRCNGGDSITAQETNIKLACDILSKFVNAYSLIVFATKVNVFKKKASDSAADKFSYGDRGGVSRDVAAADDMESDHVEFMCKAWQRLVTHRLVMRPVWHDGMPPRQGFLLGGACPNRQFVVTGAGIVIDKF